MLRKNVIIVIFASMLQIRTFKLAGDSISPLALNIPYDLINPAPPPRTRSIASRQAQTGCVSNTFGSQIYDFQSGYLLQRQCYGTTAATSNLASKAAVHIDNDSSVSEQEGADYVRDLYQILLAAGAKDIDAANLQAVLRTYKPSGIKAAVAEIMQNENGLEAIKMQVWHF